MKLKKILNIQFIKLDIQNCQNENVGVIKDNILISEYNIKIVIRAMII